MIVTLYIDKWYIAGKIITGNTAYPLSLPNKDDRIWLYFHDDTRLKEVNYGRQYRNECLSGTEGYISNIMQKSSNPPVIHNLGYEVPLGEIFRVSGIFNDIKESIEARGGTVENATIYPSFSRDIPEGLAGEFIGKLKDDGFCVNDTNRSIPIEQTCLYHLHSTQSLSFADTQQVLVINALNEDLKVSVHTYHASLGHNVLFTMEFDPIVKKGMGYNCMRNAIVEEIVTKINNSESFLRETEISREILIQMEHADEWLKRLGDTSSSIPVPFANVQLSKGNPFSPSIIPSEVESRSSRIVENLVRDIKTIIKDKGIYINDISYILLLGDVFNNTYKEKLSSGFGIDYNCIKIIHETIIPQAIAACAHFDDSFFVHQKKENEHSIYTRATNVNASQVPTISDSELYGLKYSLEELTTKFQEALNRENAVLTSTVEGVIAELKRPNFDNARRLLTPQVIPGRTVEECINESNRLISDYEDNVGHIMANNSTWKEIEKLANIVKNFLSQANKNKNEYEDWLNKINYYENQYPHYLELYHKLQKSRNLTEKRELLAQIKEISMVPQEAVDLPHVKVDLSASILEEKVHGCFMKKKTLHTLEYQVHIDEHKSDIATFPCNAYLMISNTSFANVVEETTENCISIPITKGDSGISGKLPLPDSHLCSGTMIFLQVKPEGQVLDLDVIKSKDGGAVIVHIKNPLVNK